MERRLAEAHAEAMNATVLPQLATSQDLQHLEERLDNKMSRLEQKFENLHWRHTVAIILSLVAVGGLLMRFAS